MKTLRVSLFLSVLLLGGCAHIKFNAKGDHGLTYFEPRPHLLLTQAVDIKTNLCNVTATIKMLPGERRTMKFKSGYGSSTLSVTLVDGMVTQVGQTNDSKIPETIGAVASLAGALAGPFGWRPGDKPATCTPSALLYAIDEKGNVAKEPVDFGLGK